MPKPRIAELEARIEALNLTINEQACCIKGANALAETQRQDMIDAIVPAVYRLESDLDVVETFLSAAHKDINTIKQILGMKVEP
jgi:hypothetical protein